MGSIFQETTNLSQIDVHCALHRVLFLRPQSIRIEQVVVLETTKLGGLAIPLF